MLMYALKTEPAIVENPQIVLIKPPMVIEFEKEKFTRCHDKVEFRLGHDINIWSHQASRFTLTKERRGSCDDSLGTRYVHSLKEEPSEVLDDPLHNAKIKSHMHECYGENDNREL